mmetsp:Transcript_106374/g.343139  ORF Transcript_106374/g.343139 Transcript_106374/m.343139 type:complete len:180 (+) Transcript_106374:44-583(+)
MAAPYQQMSDGLLAPGEKPRQGKQFRRMTGDDVKQDWSKLIITVAESDRMLKQLKSGDCNCEEMDEKPGDSSRHPLSRLHREQLYAQRPRSHRLAGQSDAPHLRFEPELEEERFGRKSGQYAYKGKYTCRKCGSEWEIVHDYWWSAGSSEAITGFEGAADDCLIERFLAHRTVAGAGFF